MKKFCLLFLLALVAAVGANAATWYLVGDNYGWNNNATYKFTPTADDANIHTLTVASLSGNIKIKSANSWSDSFGSNGQKLKEGVAYKANYDGGNIVVDGVIDDATITLNESAHTITVTGATAENEYEVVYLVGDFGSGWSLDYTNRPLALKEGTTNVYEGKYNLTAATSYFKMKAGINVYGTGGNDVAVILGTEYTASMSGNSYSIAAGEYTFTFVLDKNADTGKLTVTSETVEVKYPETMHIIGMVNGAGWDPTNYVAMTAVEGEDGVFSATGVEIGESDGSGYGYFSFATNAGTAGDWGSLNPRYGAAANDYVPTLGEACGIVGGENAFKVTPGKYDMVISFADMTLVVTASQIVDPLPETLYIYGNVNGDTWNPTNNYAMTKTADGVFTATEVAIGEELGSGFGYFSFAVGVGADASDWAGLGKRYGATENDYEPTSGVAFEIVRGEKAIKVVPGKYNITVDLAEMNATVEFVAVLDPDPVPETKDYTYDFINETYGMERSNNNAYNPQPYTLTDATDDLVVTLDGGNNRLWSDGVRFYSGSYMTIAIPEGAQGMITKVEYTLQNDLGTNFVLTAPEDAALTADGKVATWEGQATAVTIKYNLPSKNQAINSVKVYYTLSGTPVVDPLPEAMYVYGDVNEGTWAPANYVAMTKGENGIFTATEVAIGETPGAGFGYFNFGTAAGTEDDWTSLGTRYGAPENDFTPVSGTEYKLTQSENAFKVKPGTYTITLNMKAKTVVIETIGGTPVENGEYTYDFLNETYGMTRLSGSATDYNPNPYTLTDATDDLVVTLGGGNNRLWSDGLRFYNGAYMTIALPEGAEGVITRIEYTFKNNLGTNFKLTEPEGATLTADGKVGSWEGEATSVTIAYNPSTGNQAITGVKVYYTSSAPVPVDSPESLVLMGLVNGNIWSPEQGVEMTKDGNSFTATDVTIDGTFSFATALAATWDELNAQTRWGADADDVVLTVNPGNTTEAYLTAYEGYAAAGCKSFSVEKGKYNVTVNFTVRGTVLKLEMIERIADPNFIKVSEVVSGNTYVFYHAGNYNVDFAQQIGTGTFGYLKVTPAECENGDEFYGKVENGLTFTEVEGGWNIALANGTKLSNEGGYKTFSTVVTENELWTISVAEDGEATITNVATGGVVYLDAQYNSFGCYTADLVPAEAYKPVLYGLISEQGGDDPEVVTPEAMYIVGNINGTNWNTNDVVTMTKEGNKFTAAKVTVNDVNEGYGYFSFLTAKGANWDVVNGSDRYGSATADQLIAAGDTVDLTVYPVNVSASSATSFMVAAGNYDFTILFTADAAPTLTIVKSTDAIDAVEINAAEVEYYNLQGVRVANPENGLYIRRQGNNVSKVFVK